MKTMGGASVIGTLSTKSRGKECGGAAGVSNGAATATRADHRSPF